MDTGHRTGRLQTRIRSSILLAALDLPLRFFPLNVSLQSVTTDSDCSIAVQRVFQLSAVLKVAMLGIHDCHETFKRHVLYLLSGHGRGSVSAVRLI